MLDVVHRFDPVEADGDVAELELQRFPTEEEVDAVEDAGVEHLIPDHLVVEESREGAGVRSVPLRDLLAFVAPNIGK